jgi:formiminoglutamase
MPGHFIQLTKSDIFSITHMRKYETKLGEVISCTGDKSSPEELIKQNQGDYILVGIPEDLGVRANMGKAGTSSAWFSFLDAFLNTQSNDFFSGEAVGIIGYFDFSDLENVIKINAPVDQERLEAYRHAVTIIDEEVEEIVKLIVRNNKIPILVGGGHNNAYPAIKGAAKSLNQIGKIPLSQINCINLDAHADYRPAEGRHSGNAFRYADEDGYLNKYCIVGLHENYLQQNIWLEIINNPFIDFITYEDIFIREKKNFIQAVAHATGFTEDSFVGVELDLDAIQNTLSSAATPAGISVLQARQFLNFVGTDSRIAYVHICEGATRLETGETDPSTGKLISYLVLDFLKAHSVARD